jgi:hypothetical protein
MQKLNSKLVLTAALTAALLAGCGGGDSSSNSTTSGLTPFGAVPADISQNIASVFDYISRLIAFNDENSDAVNVNALTLAADETSSPLPLP